MNWVKKGLIFTPNSLFYWNKTHASVPTVDEISNDRLRIYYTSRNSENNGYISFIDVEASNPKNILYIHDKPVLEPGQIGMFDDSGTMASQIINNGHEKWMYYIGWNVRNTIPYHNSIGLAISKDGGYTFEKFSEGPLFDRTYKEPYFNAAPYIIKEEGVWKMWYLSNTKWVEYNGSWEPFYHIKYAESANGIDWEREGEVAIDFKDNNECGIVRACVLKEIGRYKMWYSHRNLQNYRVDSVNSYRIGYAESENGRDWLRMDELVGIDVSDQGWDSEMIEYPFVYEHKNHCYMFYNGNGFGKTGFGYAVLENK